MAKTNDDQIDEDEINEFVNSISEVTSFVTNEALIIARFEKYFKPKPAAMFGEIGVPLNELNNRIEKVIVALGGIPNSVLLFDHEPKPNYDTYSNSVFKEAITTFNRARLSITRAHMFSIGLSTHKTIPNAFDYNNNTEDKEILINIVESGFWEHLETSYIRLASYWDRVGQIMAFVFFGIRYFDREGFSTVIDKIYQNWALVDPSLKDMQAWKDLYRYKKSNSKNGMQWLVERRNLLIHAMHLRPIEQTDDELFYDSFINHLDDRLKNKLKINSISEELEIIHEHLDMAAKQLPNVISVIEYAIDASFHPKLK